MRITLTQRGLGKLLLQVHQAAPAMMVAPAMVAANDAKDNQTASPSGINSINTVTVDQGH
jgi:hypothetical protein